MAVGDRIQKGKKKAKQLAAQAWRDEELPCVDRLLLACLLLLLVPVRACCERLFMR